MPFQRLVIANRGEIAIRVARAASALDKSRAAAYLNGEQLFRIAKDYRCDAIHPGFPVTNS